MFLQQSVYRLNSLCRRMMSTSAASAGVYGSRPCVNLSTGCVNISVLTGGGHIASISTANDPYNPLWTPSWFQQSVDPSLRRLQASLAQVYGSECDGDGYNRKESELLSGIAGHNLCCDVFGSQSTNEVDKAGLCFHGEAGLVTWTVDHIDIPNSILTMDAVLPHSKLTIERTFLFPIGNVIYVRERIHNDVGFERVFGRTQHVSIDGKSRDSTFDTNCDMGQTWPDDLGSDSTLAPNTPFLFPSLPCKSGSLADWRVFPRSSKNTDLCTLRVNPRDEVGWFTTSASSAPCLMYTWRREDYPWLMTWEENKARRHSPWKNNEIVRGLEFSSYALAIGRRRNVAMNPLLDTPTFEWLDAYETVESIFTLSLTPADKISSDKESVSAFATETWRDAKLRFSKIK